MMTPGDARDASEGPAEGADRAQDPVVERLKPNPGDPVTPTLTLAGFLGDSDRPGFRRLSFTRDLGYYAEFRVEDVAHTVPVTAEQQLFAGEHATRVALRRDATVEYAWTRVAGPLDEFDLDARLGGRPIRASDRLALPAHTDCDAATCGGQGTCDTCDTACGQDTCTCDTACGQPTCGQDTCTCLTACGQFTCFDTDGCTQGGATCFSPTECVPERCFLPG
ncbi:MAG: hypothetical protein ACRD0K_03825 [Egibacteraceae bacterium]